MERLEAALSLQHLQREGKALLLVLLLLLLEELCPIICFLAALPHWADGTLQQQQGMTRGTLRAAAAAAPAEAGRKAAVAMDGRW